MAGHSKWKQIKRQKGVVDAKRGQLFTRLAREITVAARQGGPSPASNYRLRLAVQKARDHNMPSDNIERAIQRATGGAEGADLQEVTYEGYGPGGTAILVDVLTDNRNRAVSDVRSAFTRHGGNLGEAGCVAWLFDNRGVISIETAADRAEELALTAIDAGAEDFRVEDGVLEVYTKQDDLEGVRRALDEAGASVTSSELAMVPKTTVTLEEKDALPALRLLDKLEELDDVQRVHSNADFPDSVLAEYAPSGG